MSSIELGFVTQPQQSNGGLRYQPIIPLSILVVTGILIDDRFDLSYHLYAYVIVISLALWFVFRCLSFRQVSIRGIGTIRFGVFQSLLLVSATIGMAAIWHHGYWNWYGQNDISLYVGDDGIPCCVEGRIVSEPRWHTPSDSDEGMNYRPAVVRTRFGFQALRIRDRDQWQTVSGRLDLVVQNRVTEIHAGDWVRVSGHLIAVQPPSNPGQFNFQEFYRSQRKLVTLHANYAESVTVIRPASASIFRPLSLLRAELNEVAWRILYPDEAAFASALMLGNREQLSKERRESFLKTGTSHLLAISGLHVGILASSFFLFYRIGWLSRKWAIWLTILFVIFYAWLVEFRPPALRAAVLIVMYCLGKLWGKSGYGFNLLALAGLIVLAINPRDLFNLGAQLSFLAVATLNVGNRWISQPASDDPLDRLIASKRPWFIRWIFWTARQTRSAFLVSAAIWLVSLPLVAYHFHLIAPVALLINPLLLLPLAWALYAGLAMLMLGMINTSVATVPGKICEWNLNLVENMIRKAEEIPGGYCWTAGPTWQAVILFYVGLFFVAVYPPTRLRLRWLAVLAVLWFVLAWWLPDQLGRRSFFNRSASLVCTVIDVGHGSAVLLQFPDGQNWLYDAGCFGSAEFGYQNISGVLWSERIERLDAVIISHADLDHYNALLGLSRRFKIGKLYMTKQTRNSKSPSLRTLLSHLADQQVPIEIVSLEQPMEHINLRILSPPAAGTGGNDNSDSLVLLVEAYGFKILLTGDIEGAGLNQLIAQPPIQCDLVMAPHHGSFSSDPTDFMKWCRPRVVAISGQSQRINRDSVAVFQDQGRVVVRTDRQGAIRCIVEPNRAILKSWNGRGWIEHQVAGF